MIFGLQCAQSMETPPIELNKSNLAADFSFVLIKAIDIPKTNNELNLFTVVIMAKDKHHPENFEGWLDLGENQNRLAMVKVAPSKLDECLNHGAMLAVPEKWRPKSVVFEFEVSKSCLAASGFKLVESGSKYEDNPRTYHFNLKYFAE